MIEERDLVRLASSVESEKKKDCAGLVVTCKGHIIHVKGILSFLPSI